MFKNFAIASVTSLKVSPSVLKLEVDFIHSRFVIPDDKLTVIPSVTKGDMVHLRDVSVTLTEDWTGVECVLNDNGERLRKRMIVVPQGSVMTNTEGRFYRIEYTEAQLKACRGRMLTAFFEDQLPTLTNLGRFSKSENSAELVLFSEQLMVSKEMVTFIQICHDWTAVPKVAIKGINICLQWDLR